MYCLVFIFCVYTPALEKAVENMAYGEVVHNTCQAHAPVDFYASLFNWANERCTLTVPMKAC